MKWSFIKHSLFSYEQIERQIEQKDHGWTKLAIKFKNFDLRQGFLRFNFVNNSEYVNNFSQCTLFVSIACSPHELFKWLCIIAELRYLEHLYWSRIFCQIMNTLFIADHVKLACNWTSMMTISKSHKWRVSPLKNHFKPFPMIFSSPLVNSWFKKIRILCG